MVRRPPVGCTLLPLAGADNGVLLARFYAVQGMNNITQPDVDLPRMYDVLSFKPVLNQVKEGGNGKRSPNAQF